MNDDKNYYINEQIGQSGIGEIKNPLYISNDYNPMEYTPRKQFVGNYFTSDSKYDETLGDIQGAIQEGLSIDDLKARKQSSWDMMANALVNNLVIAGTTAVSGTIGLVDGIFEAAAQNDVSKLWNNDVTNWSVNVQDAAREAMPIYRGKEYEDKSIWSKMGTGIFWADLFQNLGFTEGMLIPGIGASRLLQFAPKILRASVPSFVSAIGEGAQEAVMEKNDEIINKTKLANQRYNELAYNIQSPIGLDLLDQQYREDIANIEEDAVNAGNFVFASNVALLTMTNTIEFGDLFSRGFNTAKRLKGITKRAGRQIEKESTAEAMTKAVGKKVLNAFSEGFEEVSQAIISRTPSEFDGLNRFNESQFNPEARQLASDLWSALGQSYAETMNDPNTQVEFASGFLTGALGVPVLRKSKIPIGIENNIFLDVKDAYKQLQKRNQWIDSINERLSDNKKIEAYYNGLVRKLAIQGRKNTALDKDNAFDYKTAESEGFISDAIMFDDAGQLDYLRSIINNSIDMSDEGIDTIIQNTSKNGNGPFMTNGNKMSRDEVRNILKDNIDLLNAKLESYIQDKRALETQFPNMSEEGIKSALYLKQQLRDFSTRFDTISEEVVDKVNSLINELYKQQNKTHERIDKNQFILKWSFLPSFRKEVFEALNNKNSELTYDERKEIGTKLNDLSKLSQFIETYRNALDSILKDPTKADTLASESITKMQNQYNNSQKANTVSLLSQAKSPQELESIIDNINEDLKPYVDEAINTIAKGDNQELNTTVKTYKELKNLQNNLQKAIDRIPNEEIEIKKSVVNLVNDALQNGNTAEEVINILNSHLNNLQGNETKNVRSALEAVIKRIEDASESKKASTEEDSNKPKKKIKEKQQEPEEQKGSKKKFSISELANTEDEAAEQDKATREESNEEIETLPSEKEGKPKSPIETLESILTKLSYEDLNDVASDKKKIKFKDVPESQIKSLAKTMVLLKQTTEVKEGEEAEGGSNESIPSQSEPALRSWTVTRYSFNSLKEKGVREAIKYESPKADALEELGVYEFIDSGGLGVLFNNNSNIPIHYVISNDSRLEDTVVLAIEVTQEVLKELKINGLNVISTFTSQNGKTYQAVGSLGYNSKDKKAQYGYNRLKRLLANEFDKNTKDSTQPPFFVSQKYSNRVKHLYSGRMVKSINNSPIQQKPLQEIAGETPILGVYYNSTLRVPMLSDYDEVVSLNTKNYNVRDGSVWVLSREADGRYYAKAVKVKRFTSEEFDLAANANSWIVRQILDDIETLINPEESDIERSKAKYDLMSLIYIPNEHSILFNEDSISIKGYKNNIGKDLSVEEKAKAFLEALMDKKLNFRFQVIPSKLGDPDYVSKLLEAGILTTDLAQLQNVNASFDLYIPNKFGKITDAPTRKPKGHTGSKQINNTIEVSTITLNGKTYTKINDLIKDENGKIITDIQEIEKINAFQDILNMPNYNSNILYTITLADGTKLGVKNSHTFTGKTLEQMLNKKDKEDKDKTKESNAKQATQEEEESWFESEEDSTKSTKESTESTEAATDELESWFESEEEDTEELNGEEYEELNPDELFESVEDILLEQQQQSTKENKATKKGKGMIMEEEFDEDSMPKRQIQDDEVATIKKLARKREFRTQVTGLGFKNIDELVNYISENSDKYPVTISTEEQFKILLEKISNCK